MPTPLPAAWQPDPITSVYKRLRASLLAHAGFAEIVNPTVPLRSSHIGRFPDMSDPKYQRPPAELDARDCPEILMLQSSFQLTWAGRNSLTSEIRQSFDLVMTHDHLQIVPVDQLKWHAFVALAYAGDDLGLPGLVRDWDIADAADDAFGQSEWKRGSLRYLTTARIVTTLSLPRRVVADCFSPTALI
jgi:hypothetical protein